MTAGLQLPGMEGLQEFGSNFMRLQQLFSQRESEALAPANAPANAPADVKSVEQAGSTPTLKKDKAATKPTVETPKGLASPMLDQHQFDHWNNDAFCGLATTVMMLQANGQDAGTSTRELNEYASQMYNKSAGGTSGSEMAKFLRSNGIKDSTFTTEGTTSRLVDSLESGQPVPFGVVKTIGEITRLEGGSSDRYTEKRVGDRHYRDFMKGGGSGHWVLVTRFEGKPEKPSAFYVNDPDLGGELKCTLAEITQMGGGAGNYWMVEQRSG
jgi:hypothetical protein